MEYIKLQNELLPEFKYIKYNYSSKIEKEYYFIRVSVLFFVLHPPLPTSNLDAFQWITPQDGVMSCQKNQSLILLPSLQFFKRNLVFVAIKQILLQMWNWLWALLAIRMSTSNFYWKGRMLISMYLLFRGSPLCALFLVWATDPWNVCAHQCWTVCKLGSTNWLCPWDNKTIAGILRTKNGSSMA